MSPAAKNAAVEVSMSALDAIYHRRAVRDYASEKIGEPVIRNCSMQPSMRPPPSMKNRGPLP